MNRPPRRHTTQRKNAIGGLSVELSCTWIFIAGVSDVPQPHSAGELIDWEP
jgi:hypothetical protein